MSRRILTLSLLALAALVAGAWVATMRYAPQAVAPQAVAPLWQMQFADLQGQPQPMSQWRDQVLVLNFWASWCAPCREEMPDFESLRQQYANKGVEFVGIAIDNKENVSKFIKSMPVTYPILIGEGAAHSLARQLGNSSGALPFTLVIDRTGKIVLSHLGRLSREQLDATLSGLLA